MGQLVEREDGLVMEFERTSSSLSLGLSPPHLSCILLPTRGPWYA